MEKRELKTETWATKKVNVKVSVNEINEAYSTFAAILKEVRENYEWKDCSHSPENLERINKMEKWLNDLTYKAINSDED